MKPSFLNWSIDKSEIKGNRLIPVKFKACVFAILLNYLYNI